MTTTLTTTDTGRVIWAARLRPGRPTRLTVGTSPRILAAGTPGTGRPRVYVEHDRPTLTAADVLNGVTEAQPTGPTLAFVAVQAGQPVPQGNYVGTTTAGRRVVHVYEVSLDVADDLDAEADVREAAQAALAQAAQTGGGGDDGDDDGDTTTVTPVVLP